MEADSLADVSLTDYFYADRPRLHTFLTQLFPEGNLLQTKTASRKGFSTDGIGKGGLPPIAEFNLRGGKNVEDAIERQYDAAWSAPLNFLTEITRKSLLREELDGASLGQIILLRGHLQIVDFNTLHQLWKPIQKIIQEESIIQQQRQLNRTQRRSKDSKIQFNQARKQQADEIDLTGSILTALPALIQLKCFNERYEAWGTLNPQHMLCSPSDLAFKFGPGVPGQWTVVGLLDAKPDEENPISETNTDLEKGLLTAMLQMRLYLGRPASAWGITPLLIYREVLGAAN
nr:hypothetical protein [uncultured Ottowia sp.]